MFKTQLQKLNESMNTNNPESVKIILDGFVYSFYKNSDNVTVDELRIVLEALDFVYISGLISPLSDSEYDELHSLYFKLSNNMITDKYEVSKKKTKHIYPQLKGTIEKVHFITESEKTNQTNHRSLENWLNSTMPDGHFTLGCFPKYDGVSVIFSFENNKLISAITRGDKETNMGSDVTHNFINTDFSRLLIEPTIGIKTEVCMPISSFEEYSKKYKTESRRLTDPRAAVSGIINAINAADMIKYLRIIPLEYSNKTYPNDGILFITTKKQVLEKISSIIEKMKSVIDNLDIKCDGIVIRYMDPKDQKRLSRINDVNKYEIAYKFPPQSAETTLLDVEFQMGLFGTITPVAKVKPVKLNNRTIKSVSLGSVDRMRSLHLSIGDTVIIKYEIIPWLTKNHIEPGNEIPIPEICPYCLKELQKDPTLACVNPSCKCRIMGKINNFCEKINLVGIGPSIIETLFNAGILNSIKDLFNLEKHKDLIINLDNFGLTKYNNIINSINNISAVSPSTLLGSIGIKSVGKAIFAKILNIYYIYEVLEMTIDDTDKLTEIDGIGKVTAKKVLQGIQSNRDLIEFLLDKLVVSSVVRRGYVVFSGIRNREFAKYLESQGYEIKETVDKECKAVIVKDTDTKTAKTAKAVSLGIPIIDIVSAYSVFGFKEDLK